VTGQSQLMLVSEDQEIQVDRKHSPHQFSADYGIVQDKALNDYVNQTGQRIASQTHRSRMPYSFKAVNATYVNAYAFPGGSIAATRGILLNMESEAEFAGLLGHELGHVNARHTAEQMSKGQMIQLGVGIAAAYIGTKSSSYGQVAATLGMIGAGALLSYYSRDNERQADALGMEYMVKTGYNPNGLVELMAMLRSMSKHKPNAIELMFATHPMSDERYETAIERSETEYASARNLPMHKERYMDNTAKLRAMKGAIEEMQKGEALMAKKNYPEAETHYAKALEQAPEDYTGLVMMAKCKMVQNKVDEANRYAEKAKKVYPEEAQGYHLSGLAKIKKRNFDSAYDEFASYERVLPGNPNTIFYKGLSLEGMQRIDESAQEYYRYLQMVDQGEQAKYSYQRLVEWGYLKSQ
jgi:predicted Zn-dependent protease